MTIKAPTSYWKRLLLYSILLGTIPVIVLGISSYWKSSTAIQKKVNESSMQVLKQSQLKVEYILISVDRAMSTFITSNHVFESLHQPREGFRIDLFQALQQSMNQLQQPDLGVQDIQLMNFNQNWLIKNNGLYELNETMSSALLASYKSMVPGSEWLKQKNDPVQTAYDISLVKKLPINLTPAVGMMVVRIPAYEFSRLISGGTDLGNVMILDTDYTILAHQDGQMLGKKLSDLVDISPLEQAEDIQEGTFTLINNQNNHMIIVRKSAYNGWLYVSDISINEITKDSNDIGWFTLIATLVISFTTFLLSLQGSQTMYSPIRRLYQSVASHSDPRHGTRDEFEEMIDRFGKLTNSQTQMKNELKGQLPQLQELFVFKLLQGDMNAAAMEQKLSWLGYPRWEWFTVLSLQTDSIEDTRFHESDLDLLMFAINNIVTELVPQEYGLKPILYNSSQVTIIGFDVSNEEKMKKMMVELAEEIQLNILQYLSLKVSIGISRAYGSFQNIPKALEEAEEALKYRITFGEGSILFIDQVQPNRLNQIRFPEETVKKLMDAVKLSDASLVEEYFHQLMTELVNEKLSHREVQMFMVRLIIDFMKEVDESSELYEALYKAQRTLFEETFVLKTSQEVASWARNTIVMPTMKSIEERTRFHYKKISNQMLLLIHQEFDKDISLESCADRLNYHPDYIKKVFRKETGINFSDYLFQYRMGIAKTWLRDTEWKISEIAEKLRYTNAQNFIRSFRKYEEMTPGQYREESKKITHDSK